MSAVREFGRTLTQPLGAPATGRGTGRNPFTDSAPGAVDDFYGAVAQNPGPWAAAAPRVRPEEVFAPPADVPAALVPTAPSSQDGAVSSTTAATSGRPTSRG
ncbi:hypothetical protein [Saccharothrix syringae]|uniref:Uncharacterized protein n=1 Tax=Saccharothrix syringae TaxID=103733 RepID=A0A5Q0GSJ8_SACSY|nr:hypothetical protein [Saccharothrix syringae]QFZ16635.1 hypothetical protein EKG83_03355 [Saccharothrix syringae]